MLRSSHARYLARLVAAGLTSAAALVIAELAIIATRTPRLPPAPGPREGRSGETGKLPALRLLVFGDSVACGVGCPSNEDALAGGLARRIAATTARAVDWTVLGLSGATAASMDAALVPRIAAPYDVVVISVGVNHVISLHSPARYERELAALLARLRARCGARARIVVCDCPPMHAFPQISYLWPARELFRRYAAAMTAAARRACARTLVCSLVQVHGSWACSAIENYCGHRGLPPPQQSGAARSRARLCAADLGAGLRKLWDRASLIGACTLAMALVPPRLARAQRALRCVSLLLFALQCGVMEAAARLREESAREKLE